MKHRKSLAIVWFTLATLVGRSAPAPAQAPLELQLRKEPTGWEIVWNADSVPVSPGRTTEFEIQRSTDLKNWHREGLLRPSGARDERLRHPLPNLGPQGYFRVVARSRSAAAQTAQGGAEVFGYTGRFLEELEQVGQITPEQFAALHPQPTYGPGIAWDPADAVFWESMNTAPEDKDRDQGADGEWLPRFDLRLDDRETALLKNNGFVVSERLGTASFAESFYRIWNDDLPVFVSADSMMQAWHRSYDAMLEELEETSLFLPQYEFVWVDGTGSGRSNLRCDATR